MASLKSITIRQPWAALIAHGFKDVENRSWATAYRGPLLIHAGKRPDCGNGSVNNALLAVASINNRVFTRAEEDAMKAVPTPLGAVVGIVDLVDVVQGHKSPWSRPGGFHWVLANPRRIQPVPLPGRLGLWNADISIKIIQEAA